MGFEVKEVTSDRKEKVLLQIIIMLANVIIEL
jgi:hypothetical protein